MSEEKNKSIEKNKIVIKTQGAPILVKKENKIRLFQGEKMIKNIKFGPASSLYQEDVIFESKPGDLIRDSPVKITIMNRFDLLKNYTRTVVTYFDQLNSRVLSEKTSDHIVKIIGQSNYEAVIGALLTVNDEEVKVKAIIALLTKQTVEDQSTQTINSENDFEDSPEVKIKSESSKIVDDKFCQTDENCMDLIYKFKTRKKLKRKALTPYPVKDNPEKIIKRVFIHPTKQKQQIKKDMDMLPYSDQDPLADSKANVEKIIKEDVDIGKLPELHLSDDNSNDSTPTLSGSLCSDTCLQIAENFVVQSIGLHTTAAPTVAVLNSQKHPLHLPNGEVLTLPVKPEYPYHMATPEILKTLNDEDKVKLVGYQAYLDFKMCLMRNADGYLPIHYAVLNNDLDLLRRQCVVLKYRQKSLDVTYGNLTPLQLSISQDTPQCTALLLQYGADPLLTDEEHRTCLHLASESSSDHLRAVINHCESNAKEILEDNDMWKEEYEGKSKEVLAAILLKHMCEMFDNQGYNPLMVAAKSGNYIAVKMLLEASPDCIDLQMPNCGNTALFLAVEGACYDASNRGNKSKVADHYNRTISILLENHATNTIPNHSGITINDLLSDNNNAELAMLFANKVTSRFFDGHLPGGSQFDSYMLYKNEEGNVDITEVNKTKADLEELRREKKNYTRVKTAQIQTKKPGQSLLLKVKEEDTKAEVSDAKNPNLIFTTSQNKRSLLINNKNDTNLIKKEKPIILENITIPQSKIIIDPNSVNTQNIKFISPKQKLIYKTAITNSMISKKVKVVTPTNFANKRKSDIEPGPSDKKIKVESLDT